MASKETLTPNMASPGSLEQNRPATSNINTGSVERWISVIGGSALVLGGAALDLSQRKVSIGGIALALVGGAFIYQGATGHSYLYQALGINTNQQAAANTGFKVEKAMTIYHGHGELYHLWKDSSATNQSESAQTTSPGNAEVSEQQAKELQAWSKLQQAVAAQNGYIEFQDAPGGRGSVVKVMFYDNPPPFGKVGSTIAGILGKSTLAQITEDLRHFKEVVEAGEIPTTKGQPSGS